jgi:hypothetical protein
MGVDLFGYVEVSRWEPEARGDEHAWTAAVTLSALIDSCDEVSELLFGFSKRALSAGKLPFEPIARGRGIPRNASQQVRDDLERIEEFETRSGKGESRGYTYIDIAEIESIDWESIGILPEKSEWSLVFGLIQVLRSDSRFQEAGIRIVCWAVW